MRHDKHLNEATPEALLARYASGDTLASKVLAQRVVPRLLALATRLLAGDRAEAEDVVQDAMLRLWRIAPDWRRGEAKISTWLYRVTVNLCTDRRRKARASTLEDAPEPADSAPSATEQLAAAQRLKALDKALAELPERQRQAVVLRHIEGLSNPEIAKVMEVGVEAVESLTARGKRTLKAALHGRRKELGYEDE